MKGLRGSIKGVAMHPRTSLPSWFRWEVALRKLELPKPMLVGSLTPLQQRDPTAQPGPWWWQPAVRLISPSRPIPSCLAETSPDPRRSNRSASIGCSLTGTALGHQLGAVRPMHRPPSRPADFAPRCERRRLVMKSSTFYPWRLSARVSPPSRGPCSRRRTCPRQLARIVRAPPA